MSSLGHVVFLCALLLPVCAGAQQVQLKSGLLEGERLDQVDRYLGIPYAAPPVGELRWRAPRPVPSWKGVRRASSPGNACVQTGGMYASNDPTTFDRPYGSEDCLYLNVWAPVERSGPRPVLFFIHGGSGVAGDSIYPIYDGARLAQENQIVVVTVNYRLGVLGSLQIPALMTGVAAEDSGSFFLLDLIQALNWVQDNVAAFGGDPGNVTISGHSAGAISVFSLLRSPLAHGMFQRAISYSGFAASSSMDAARQRGQAVLGALMMKDGLIKSTTELASREEAMGEDAVRAYLLGKSGSELLAISKDIPGGACPADGTVQPHSAKPDDALSVPLSNPVPLMAGTVSDETSLLLLSPKLSQAERWHLLSGDSASASKSARELLGQWKYMGYATTRFFGERVLQNRIREMYDRLVPQVPALYVYRFEWDGYPDPWRKQFGVFHGLDVPFVFNNFISDRPNFARFAWTADNAAAREDLHRRMAVTLRGFMETGDPNLYLPQGSPAWKRWGPRRFVQVWN